MSSGVLFPPDRRPLLKTLEGAWRLGFQLRTWFPYIEELVSHIKGPVLLEWTNHFRGLSKDQVEAMLRTAPALIYIFHRWVDAQGGSLESIVEEIIGKTNAQENAAEFLKEEFGIESHELPPQDSPDEAERQRVFGAWLAGKRRLRELAHQLKAGEGVSLDPLKITAKVDVLADEYI